MISQWLTYWRTISMDAPAESRGGCGHRPLAKREGEASLLASPLFIPACELTPARASQATPAALSVARTLAGVIGDWRRRTPVASKKALAIAAPMHELGGSPDPDE